MKPSKLILGIAVTVTVVWVLAVSIRASAQENVVSYLDKKFKEKNIPVTEITILEETPLRLHIVVQSVDKWTTTDDTVILNSVERVVFLEARQDGYKIEYLASVLQDNQGRQLDYTEKHANDKKLEKALNSKRSSLKLNDEKTKNRLIKKINPFLNEYNLHGVPIVLNVSSEDENQTVSLTLQTSSLEVANNAAFFFWTLPNFALFDEINAEGGNIILYRAKITDENGSKLLDFAYDIQLESGGWTQSNKLIDLSGSPAPNP